MSTMRSIPQSPFLVINSQEVEVVRSRLLSSSLCATTTGTNTPGMPVKSDGSHTSKDDVATERGLRRQA